MRIAIDRAMLRIIRPHHEIWYLWPWQRTRAEARYITLDGAGMTWDSLDHERAFWRMYCIYEGATEAEAMKLYPPLPRWARLLERLLP